MNLKQLYREANEHPESVRDLIASVHQCAATSPTQCLNPSDNCQAACEGHTRNLLEWLFDYNNQRQRNASFAISVWVTPSFKLTVELIRTSRKNSKSRSKIFRYEVLYLIDTLGQSGDDENPSVDMVVKRNVPTELQDTLLWLLGRAEEWTAELEDGNEMSEEGSKRLTMSASRSLSFRAILSTLHSVMTAYYVSASIRVNESPEMSLSAFLEAHWGTVTSKLETLLYEEAFPTAYFKRKMQNPSERDTKRSRYE